MSKFKYVDFAPWFRVFKWDGSYEDIAATMSQCSGKRLKDRMFELYNDVDVRSVVVLTYNKQRVIKAATKREEQRP